MGLPDAARDELGRTATAVRERVGDAAWVPVENMHLTLAFLGAVDEQRVGEVSSALGRSVEGIADVPAHLDGVGAFPSARRARVLWAGLSDPVGGLAGLAESVLSSLEGVGFPRERRAFHPHVTLARLRQPRAVSLDGLEPAPIALVVDRIVLYESRLGRPHATYEARATFPFGRSAGSSQT
jgi:2'-5' RNA ligase